MTAFHGSSAQIRGDGALASMTVTRFILRSNGMFYELNIVTAPVVPVNK